jgi:hypothetical protein
MAELAFEPMSIGQILDRTFSIYKRNFVRFLAIVAVVTVPLRLAYLGGVLALTGLSAQQGPEAFPFDAAAVGVLVLGGLVLMLGNTLCNAALLRGVSQTYLGSSISVGEAYRKVLPKLLALIVAAFLVGLLTMIGFILLIVPGVIILLRFAVTVPAIVVEDVGATRGMGRSWRLAAGNTGKILGLFLCVALIGFIANTVFQGATRVLAHQCPEQARFFVSQLGSLVGDVFVMPISATATILLYYDLRIRKEGFDLEMLAQRLSGEGGASDVADYPS